MSKLLEGMAEYKRRVTEIVGEVKSIYIDEFGSDLYFSTKRNYIKEDLYLPLIIQHKTAGFVELIVTVAQDEDGNPVPEKFMRSLLIDLDPDRIREIGSKIYEILRESSGDDVDPGKS